MHLAEEGQHVVLAEAEHFDVFHDDHLVVINGEQRALEQSFGIFVVSLVRNFMAFWTRSGVVARPSRAGSSPSRTSISRTRSSNRALVSVGVSAFWSTAAVFMLADELPFSITTPHGLRSKVRPKTTS